MFLKNAEKLLMKRTGRLGRPPIHCDLNVEILPSEDQVVIV